MPKSGNRPVASGAPVRTTCPYCGVGCGVLAVPNTSSAKSGGSANGTAPGAVIQGDPEHPANMGRLCSKGSALGETLALETRLLYPQIGGKRVPWTDALDHVAGELTRIRDAHGPKSIAFYLSGQLLTEDYYVANKLAKGFIGTPHVDTNSRLCMASSVAGHKRAFGADVVPQCYDDLELADLVVLAGSNAAWCHPILYQRIQVARGERGMRVVNIDPRRTATSEGSDLQLSIAPGTDTVLWNGLLVWLSDHGALDRAFIAKNTDGFEPALAAARIEAGSIPAVAAATGLGARDIETFYGWWTGTPRIVSCYSQGVNQSAQGTDKVNAIINCHLATGRIGKPGSGPFSFTGQPNAMGGREVGGLANMLAAHMGFTDAERDRVRRFWQAPNLVTGEGLKAVQMFDAVERGEIKAVWVMGTNPAVSLPRADDVIGGLKGLELLVVSENVAANDTANCAHVRLPAAAWGEKDGTVTNSERRISRQRAFLPLAGEVKPDWWILGEVAKRLGWATAFAWTKPSQIFAEHARLSGFENTGERAFDISGLADLTPHQYDALLPIQWPVRRRPPSPMKQAGTERLFADGRFFTPSGKARFVVSEPAALGRPVSNEWPFLLNTGRVRDQWHTMTRTALSPRLSSHIAEPYVEIHPDDASGLGLEQGTLARIESAHGAAVVRVLVSRNQRPGSLFMPIHWSGENSSLARAGALVHDLLDPFSGQPEMKATPVRIASVAVSHYGFAMSRGAMRPAGALYWSGARIAAGHLINFALDTPSSGWRAWAKDLLPQGDEVSVEDEGGGLFRIAVLRNARLEAVMFVAPTPKLPSQEWLKAQFDAAQVPAQGRRSLLAGRPVHGGMDEGPIVCVCFQVGAHRIAAAIDAGAATVAAVGEKLGAGTNCGSCVPEIRRMMVAKQTSAASAVAAAKPQPSVPH